MDNITIIIILISILFLFIILNHVSIIKPVNPVGGCSGTIYGCCPNGITPKMNALGTNCLRI
jgi:hypothetical protein